MKINALRYARNLLFVVLSAGWTHYATASATIDIMIIYDTTAESWVSANGGMNLFAANAVAEMNQAMVNSDIDLTFRLVHAASIDYAHVSFTADLRSLQSGRGVFSDVHDWRDLYRADLVAMLVDTGQMYDERGLGYLLYSTRGQPNYAFSVNAIRPAIPYHIITHEVGHNLGADHSKFQDSGPGPNKALNSYSAGWYFTGNDGTNYCTVMSYNRKERDGPLYTRIPVFSSPLLQYKGVTAGCPLDGDNARTIRQTKHIVATYRSEHTVPPPRFMPDGGVYSGDSVEVTIRCVLPGAMIRYTTDGADPTESSPSIISGDSVTVPASGGILRAKAWKDQMTPSPVRSAIYLSDIPADYKVINLSEHCMAHGDEGFSYSIGYMEDMSYDDWPREFKTEMLVMRRIPAGTFIMGSDLYELGTEAWEDQHQVTLTEDFYIGVFPVTQEQWRWVMSDRPSYFTNTLYRATRPVERVSYYSIREQGYYIPIDSSWPETGDVGSESFIGRLRRRTGLQTIDLPTEAQWEYACRAGTTTSLNSGKNITDREECPNMSEVGRYHFNGGIEGGANPNAPEAFGTAPVGLYLPNQWGLYDMHGNAWEWCLDWYGPYPEDAVTDPAGLTTDEAEAQSPISWLPFPSRVCRGGSWVHFAADNRSAKRFHFRPGTRYEHLGFRVVMTITNAVAPPADVTASRGTYTGKVRISWNAVEGATSYKVWRNMINNSASAEFLDDVPATVAATVGRGIPDPRSATAATAESAYGGSLQTSPLAFDDTTAGEATTYFYWVTAVNSAGESTFSSVAVGYPGVTGPLVSINGMIGDNVRIPAGTPITIAVEMMNLPAGYIGHVVDWWVAALMHSGNLWYYLNSDMAFTPFDGHLTNMYPAHTGPLGNLPRRTVAQLPSLPQGTYNVWFAVSYPAGHILNISDPNTYMLSRFTVLVE